MQISNGSEVVLDACVVKNVGEYGVVIQDGTSHGVKNCHISDIGACAVYISGGFRQSLTPCGHFARNNEIERFGLWNRIFTPGVWLDGVGILIEHNRIHDSSHFAIYHTGNNHMVRCNEIYAVCSEVDDAGAIYGGRDWGFRGNVFRNNFIHDIESIQGGIAVHGVHGVYLDDCYSSADVSGNVFYRVSGDAILIGGGRDNRFENNIAARCGTVVYADRRGATWNVIGNPAYGPSWDLLGKIESMNYTQPPWSTAYPKLAAIVDEGFEEAKEPKGNMLLRNLGWFISQWFIGDGLAYFIIQNNVANQDPLFVDEANLNLALREDSPAYGIPGFERIPFEWIGRLMADRACRPNPADGAALTAAPVRLYWAPALDTASRDVYFSDDPAAVAAGDELSPAYRGRLTETVFEPGVLGSGTYYWRVDELDENGNPLSTGEVWTFSF